MEPQSTEPQLVKTEEQEPSINQLLETNKEYPAIKQEDSSKDDTPVTNTPSSLPPPVNPHPTSPTPPETTPNNDTIVDTETQDASVIFPPSTTPITTFEEIQKQLKSTLDHVEQRNMVSGFQTLSKATGAVVDNCEQLGKHHSPQH